MNIDKNEDPKPIEIESNESISIDQGWKPVNSILISI